MADVCDVPGCGQGAKLFAPTRVRCLAHAAADEPALRSDEPAARVDEDGCCTTCGRDVVGCYACDRPARRLRVRLAFAEIARAEAARERDETAAEAFGAGETHAAAVVAEWVERCTEAARILETFGDIGGMSALRALRGTR